MSKSPEQPKGSLSYEELLASVHKRKIDALPHEFLKPKRKLLLTPLAKRGQVLAETNSKMAMILRVEGREISIGTEERNGNAMGHYQMDGHSLWLQDDGSVIIVKDSGSIYRLQIPAPTMEQGKTASEGTTSLIAWIRSRIGI